MKRKTQLVVCCLILFLPSCHREPRNLPALFSFRLPLSNDSQLNFETLKNSKASVFVFLAPDCPQSQSYTLTLNELHAKFAKDGVRFYGVITGKNYGRKEIDDFITQYRIGFPMVLDREANLAQFFEAMVTPEVFLVNSAGKTVYQGAIDNGAPELGLHRAVISQRYLLEGLDSFIRTGSVSVGRTNAVGCFIERGN